MKLLKKMYLLSALFIITLLMFSINNKVLGAEKIEDIEDINYIPKEEYVLIENDKGSFKVDNNGNKYFYYEGVQQYEDILEIIHKDGTKSEYKYEGEYDDYVHYKNSNGEELKGIDSNGKYKRPNFLTNQENVHWKLGTNNYATIEFLGIEKKIPVTITESPVKAIKYIPVSNVIHTNNSRIASNYTDRIAVNYERN